MKCWRTIIWGLVSVLSQIPFVLKRLIGCFLRASLHYQTTLIYKNVEIISSSNKHKSGRDAKPCHVQIFFFVFFLEMVRYKKCSQLCQKSDLYNWPTYLPTYLPTYKFWQNRKSKIVTKLKDINNDRTWKHKLRLN